jgi:nucleotide-binding universal stress UspA family protein
VDYAISHVLVPVDVEDDSRAAALAAIHLASGSGALVTLLAVREPEVKLTPSAQLDAFDNLHRVLTAPAGARQFAPAFPAADQEWTLRQLRTLRDRLAAQSPDHLQIRVVCREGEPLDEVRAFVEEAGVDVVVVEAPATCRSSVLRRLARGLQNRCPCHVHTIHPPRPAAETLGEVCGRWWRSLAARCGLASRATPDE